MELHYPPPIKVRIAQVISLRTLSGRVLLQDIMTQEKHLCYVPAGYWGEKGQCWLARILPSISELFDYSILFNTPYILMGESKDDVN